MTNAPSPNPQRRLAILGGVVLAALVVTALLTRGSPPPWARGEPMKLPVASAGGGWPGGLLGVLTFATPGAGDPFGPQMVQDLDLATGRMTVRFDGLEASRAPGGETAFVSRLAPGWSAPHGIVVADARGVPDAPVYVCKDYNWHQNAGIGLPKLSPDGRYVAFVARDGTGSVCRNSFGMFWSDFVVVSDRKGERVARFEGYTSPEWLPDGRLLILGTQCREGGIWTVDPAFRSTTRIDGGKVATPASAAAARPDGRRIVFVWNRQLWTIPLEGDPEPTQLTHFARSVAAAAYSPDGSLVAMLLFDVSMPNQSVVLMRPGDEASATTLAVPVYPYGPLSWRSRRRGRGHGRGTPGRRRRERPRVAPTSRA